MWCSGNLNEDLWSVKESRWENATPYDPFECDEELRAVRTVQHFGHSVHSGETLRHTQHFQHAMHTAFLDRKQCDWSHFSCQIYNKLHDMTRFKNALAFIRIFRFGDEWKNFLIKPNSMKTSCSSERMKSACNFGSLALQLLVSLSRSFVLCALFETITSNGPVWLYVFISNVQWSWCDSKTLNPLSVRLVLAD